MDNEITRVTVTIRIPKGEPCPTIIICPPADHPAWPPPAYNIRTVGTSAAKALPAAQGPESGGGTAAAPAPPLADVTVEQCIEALKIAGIGQPEKILATYSPARVWQVCMAAAALPKAPKNPAGWIINALKRGWTV